MKWNWDTADRVVFIVGMLAGIAFLTTLSVFLVKAANGTPGDWSGWVQAFGSIGAIFGAAAIADGGRRHAQAERRRDLLRKEGKSVIRVNAGLDAVHTQIGELRMALKGQHDSRPEDGLDAVRACEMMFRTALESVDELGGIWVQGHFVLRRIPLVIDKAQKVMAAQKILTPLERYVGTRDKEQRDKLGKARAAEIAALEDLDKAIDLLNGPATAVRDYCTSFRAKPELTSLDEY